MFSVYCLFNVLGFNEQPYFLIWFEHGHHWVGPRSWFFMFHNDTIFQHPIKVVLDLVTKWNRYTSRGVSLVLPMWQSLYCVFWEDIPSLWNCLWTLCIYHQECVYVFYVTFTPWTLSTSPIDAHVSAPRIGTISCTLAVIFVISQCSPWNPNLLTRTWFSLKPLVSHAIVQFLPPFSRLDLIQSWWVSLWSCAFLFLSQYDLSPLHLVVPGIKDSILLIA